MDKPNQIVALLWQCISWCIGSIVTAALLIEIPSHWIWVWELPRWVRITYVAGVILIAVVVVLDSLTWKERSAWEWLRAHPTIASAERRLPLWKAQLYRLIVRTLRIAIGASVGCMSIWGIFKAYDTLSKPFSALSPVELVGGMIGAVSCIWFLVPAFRIAFGEGDHIKVDRLKAELADEQRRQRDEYKRRLDEEGRILREKFGNDRD